MFTRRQALRSLFAAGTGALLTGFYTWRVEPHWLEFTYPVLPIRGLPRELAGKTLAQLTDLHVGPQVDDNYIIHSFQRVREQAPDFVVVTGDWISYRGPQQFEQLRRVMEHMPLGRLGTVGILGNHDYGNRWRMTDVADRLSGIARNTGVTMLSNEAVTFAGLQFIGLDDLWSPRFAPAAVLAENNRDAKIVLDAADVPVWDKYTGWILAGHTHGGQCKPPFLPPPELPVKNRRYTTGEISLSGDRKLYISRGIGHLRRVRFNVRPEIPIFRLQRDESAG